MRSFTLSSFILLLLLVFSLHCDEAVVAAQKEGIGRNSGDNRNNGRNKGRNNGRNKGRLPTCRSPADQRDCEPIRE